MKRLVPIPRELVDNLKKTEETGIGYQVISVELRDGRRFDQVLAIQCEEPGGWRAGLALAQHAPHLIHAKSC